MFTPMSTPLPSPATTSSKGSGAPLSVADSVGVAAGFLLHAVVGVFVFSSGLLMPAWAIALMILLWVVALWFAIRHRRQPLAVLVTPLATFGLWYLTGWAGETFLGWTG